MLRFFFVAAPGGLVAGLADLCRHFEALAVVGPFFVEQLVGRGRAVLTLGELLQQRLIVAPQFASGGQFDFLVPVPVLQRTRAELPNARFELIRYARHLPQLERPDAVNRQIEGFIERRRSWRGEEDDEQGEDGR